MNFQHYIFRNTNPGILFNSEQRRAELEELENDILNRCPDLATHRLDIGIEWLESTEQDYIPVLSITGFTSGRSGVLLYLYIKEVGGVRKVFLHAPSQKEYRPTEVSLVEELNDSVLAKALSTYDF